MKLLPVVFVLSLAACGGGDGPADPNEGGFDNFTAKIDGSDWNAEFPPSAGNSLPGLYVITGIRTTGTAYTMSLSLSNITGPGTYPLGVGTQVFGGSAVLSNASTGWATTIDGDAGEVTITTVTATRIVGTFEFVADPQGGSTGTHTVTEGQFDIMFNAGAGVAPANKGSSVTGNVGGPFTAGAVAGGIAGGTPILTVVANNITRSVGITVTNMTGPSTYTLDGGAGRTISLTGAPGNVGASWISSLAGGSGSVSVTSVTADRIMGTFTATVVPLGGGATGNVTISGSFNLGRG